MQSAVLSNGKIVTADEFNSEIHGNSLYCYDKSCKAPVIFVKGSDHMAPHFKTTGKSEENKHHINCGFYRPLSFLESINKVKEYQEGMLKGGIKQNIVKINFNKLDPDYEPKTVEREEKEKKPIDPTEIKIKQENESTKSIGSLKAIVNLLTSYDPGILSSIVVQVKGTKIPISKLILHSDKAYPLHWSNELLETPYFVYGKVERVIRREKVYFIAFESYNNSKFSLVVFDKYFKHFSLRDEQLVGKEVISYGYLKKNAYNQDIKRSELSIKSDKFIQILNSKG
ncbi:hypothetical protein M3936_19740 [Sutcliffiella horikoshii]|uniref:hypothetical protein n=1 Tax=Sutcliffiella horikoshii TaxID=79883 RepID=UPI001CBE3C74|nr:hypothetical protein [Sutcliffiella horikoshii]MCM3619807.1 hypothetical protein [Sutcliffiella horikoshii]UAL49857.1 hypothetical protein K7887_22330 [Sutcliffiella horikoshii]